MKIMKVYKRYCYKQESNLSSAISKVNELEQKHPDETIYIEFNERSTYTKYRVVKMTAKDIEIPQEPDKLPPRPEAAPLKKEDFTQVVRVEKVKPARNGHYSPYYDRNTYTLVTTHVPTGTVKESRVWSEKDPGTWTLKYQRDKIAEELDPTFAEREARWREGLRVRSSSSGPTQLRNRPYLTTN